MTTITFSSQSTERIRKLFSFSRIVMVLALFPQILKIWETHTDHVDGHSLITWTVFTLGAIIGGLYGLSINEKPLFLFYAVVGILYFIIVVGILLQTTSFW